MGFEIEASAFQSLALLEREDSKFGGASAKIGRFRTHYNRFMIRSAGYYLPVPIRLSATAVWIFASPPSEFTEIIQNMYKRI